MHDDAKPTPKVTAEEGFVVVDGVPGCASTLTVEEAQDLSAQLGVAAIVALTQRATD
jgi:hypothetical protein